MATDMKKFYDNMDKYNFLTPNISFPGELFITNQEDMTYHPEEDEMVLNAKEKNGRNLYTDFINQYYFNGIVSIRDERKKFNEYYPMILMTTDKNRHRSLVFDYRPSLTTILFIATGVSGDHSIIPSDVDELEYAKEQLRQARKEVKDVKVNGEQSKYYNRIYLMYKSFNVEFIVENLDKLVVLLTGYIVTISNFKKNREAHPTIDIEKLKNCFDIDKLYLLIARAILKYQKSIWRKDKKIEPIYSQLLFYMSNVLENTDTDTYNPTIRVYNQDTQKYDKYTLLNLKKEMFALEKEINSKEYRGKSFEDYENLPYHIKPSDFLAAINKDDFEALQMSWTFIPAGTTQKNDGEIDKESSKENVTTSEEKPESTISVEESNDSKNTAALYHKIVLDKTNYKCKIVGKEKFAGYIGYIYANGLVAFEKLYENNLKKFSRKNNATYVMKFTNFAKFTRLTKQKIISYIKNTANPEVKRFYHSASWERKLLNFLNGVAYNDEINALIDAFIETQQEYKMSLDKE